MSADSPVGVAEEPKQELEEKEVAEGEKEGDEGPTKKRKLNDSAKVNPPSYARNFFLFF